MPLAALLVTGAIVARNDVVQASRQRALELARLGAEQQDSIVKEARTLLTVISRLTVSGKLGQDNCFALFEQIVADHPAVASLAIIDDKGLAGCISADPAIRLDVSNRPFVRRLLRPGAAGFDLSDLVFSRQTGLPAIFIGLALPPRPGRDHPDGIVVAGLNLDWFRSLSGTIGRGGRSSSAVLLDARDGTILSSYPQLDRKFLRPAYDGPVLSAYRRALGLAGNAEGPGVNGADQILGYAPLPGTSNQIVVAVGLDRAQVLAQANARVALAFGLVLAALLLAAGIASLAAWLMVILPMAAFTRTATRLADGDLQARVVMPAWQAPELRHLAATLNTMAMHVSDAQAKLGRNAEELHVTNRELERLAVHLARARDKAEHASTAKSRFLAGMSHELRTPLNGILGYSQLLRDEGGLAPPQLARVEAMLGAGAHLLQMINRVLDLTEIEADHVHLQPAPLDVRHLLESCLDLVRPTADAKGLHLALVVAPATPVSIVADGTRLRQVVLNLLGNAVKFTPAGRIELRVPALSDSALRLEVADTGPGIPQARQHLLFQEFERLDAEATGDAEGAGLGLAISDRLAKLMGGTLAYHDDPGGGSLFRLDLPLSPAPAARQSSGTPEATAPSHRALHVLVADDAEMNRDVARAFLQAAGHRVTCVEGGAEAAEAAAAMDFDVVLMDVRMPRVDGLAATCRIRALAPPRGNVPIVALTAQAFAGQVQECLAAGMDAHLTKPYAPAALLQAAADAADLRPQAIRGKADPPLSPPVFDMAVFKRTSSFLQEDLVATYLETISERCRILLQDLRASPLPQGTQAAAHALCGSAGMFGFERLTAAAAAYDRSPGQEGGERLQGEIVTVIELIREGPASFFKKRSNSSEAESTAREAVPF